MTNILKEYHHMMEHENSDCINKTTLDCLLRKYGATLISLLGLIMISVWRISTKLDSLFKEKSKKLI